MASDPKGESADAIRAIAAMSDEQFADFAAAIESVPPAFYTGTMVEAMSKRSGLDDGVAQPIIEAIGPPIAAGQLMGASPEEGVEYLLSMATEGGLEQQLASGVRGRLTRLMDVSSFVRGSVISRRLADMPNVLRSADSRVEPLVSMEPTIDRPFASVLGSLTLRVTNGHQLSELRVTLDDSDFESLADVLEELKGKMARAVRGLEERGFDIVRPFPASEQVPVDTLSAEDMPSD